MSFTLDSRLAADTEEITRLSLCYVGLMNDARFPWLILVPMREGAVELIDLSAEDRTRLMEEISLCSEAMRTLFSPHKLNVAALGNVVPQLHVHVIGRQQDDEAWPNPVWGVGQRQAYTQDALTAVCEKLRAAL